MQLSRRGFMAATAGGIACTFGAASGEAEPARHSGRPVPLIDITDLYHPPQDPGDNLDLIAAYALPEVDLKAVILDRDRHADLIRVMPLVDHAGRLQNADIQVGNPRQTNEQGLEGCLAHSLCARVLPIGVIDHAFPGLGVPAGAGNKDMGIGVLAQSFFKILRPSIHQCPIKGVAMNPAMKLAALFGQGPGVP